MKILFKYITKKK